MAIHIIRTQQEVEALLPILMARPIWGFDTETTGLDAHDDKVTLVQVGNELDQYVMDSRKVNIQPLRPFFESRGHRKVVHHGKFDYKMMKGTHGIEVESLRDTMQADQIYHNGRKDRGFALDDVALAWLKVEIDKSLQKSFINHVGDYSPEQINYAAMDVVHLCPLAQKMANALNKDGQLAVWQMEGDCIPAFGDMEFRGLKLDVEKWRGLIEKNTRLAEEARTAMNPYVAAFPHLFPVDLFGTAMINYDSPAQLLALLRARGIRVKRFVKGVEVEALISDTNDRTLAKVQKYPVVKLLQDHRGYMMRLSHFGQKFIDAINPKTGRIHPEFHQIGTATGRPSSNKKSPVNMLNIPHEPEVRNCFITEDDWEVQTDDYSGCELRIWAYESQDPFLLDAFLRGLDVHCHVASMLYRKEVTKKNENKHLRTPVKKLNFGIAYGMGYVKLYEDLNGEGFPILLDESKGLFRSYERGLDTGVRWIRGQGKLAAEQGFLSNSFGRRRYFVRPNAEDKASFPLGDQDEAYRGAIADINRAGGNFPMQGTNADMTKLSMIALRNWKKDRNIRMEILLNKYDELVTESPKAYSQEVSAVKRKLMVDNANRFLSGREGFKDVPMEVEGHILPYWTK